MLQRPFDFAARRPLASITTAAIIAGNDTGSTLTIMGALTAAWVVGALTMYKKTGLNPAVLRGRFYDRAVNRLQAQTQEDGSPKYADDHPKIMTNKMLAASQRASYMDHRNITRILG